MGAPGVTFALWTMLGLVWIFGGLIDTTLREASADVSDINSIVASAEVLKVDDSGLSDGVSLNAAIGITSAIGDSITKAMSLLSFNYIFLVGPLQLIRVILGVWAMAMILTAIRDYGPTIVGAIRAINPFG
jgi:hypothetical protein